MTSEEVLPTATDLVEAALARLLDMPGYSERAGQLHLAQVVCDLIGHGQRGLIEAPTGLGKSLAALIPAIAQAIVSGKRTVIATYTNVLAEQYWRKDLPLALSLFESSSGIRCAFLIGRQRYVCRLGLRDTMPSEFPEYSNRLDLGIDTEFRKLSRSPYASINSLWQKVSVPPVCPARLCPEYDSCWFYGARKQAERAQIVITNHSVVIQDALNAKHSDSGEGMLGAYDFLIVDEGHDFIQAAQSGLEFDLSSAELHMLMGLCGRIESALSTIADQCHGKRELTDLCEEFRSGASMIERDLATYGLQLAKGGILKTSPSSLEEHPSVKSALAPNGLEGATRIATSLFECCHRFVSALTKLLTQWEDSAGESVKQAKEAVRNYMNYMSEIGAEALALLQPEGVTVSYVRSHTSSAALRSDTIGLAEPLTELIWDRKPYVLLSATLAIDNDFAFMRRTLGCQPDFEEVLPSPFDYCHQAALFIPKTGRVSDPSVARKNGTEPAYFQQIADHLTEIITTMGGRTLALFHSRREMDEVNKRMTLPPGLPILVQPSSGAAYIGDQFKEEENASLFGLRSFWTGFDAPGVTLSCVAIVRIPFEVPIEPPALARMAHLTQLGLEPFSSWTLPMSKMIVRQGAGRLIRHNDDRGVIAILDPRIRTKRYGEEMLANLPPELRTFSDLADALGHIGWER